MAHEKITNKSRFRGAIHLTASVSGRPVARIDTTQIGKTSIIEGFVVQRSFRNRGIGSKLLQRAERLAKKQGATRIARIGLFCEADSITSWLKLTRHLVHRGYKNFGVILTKKLK